MTKFVRDNQRDFGVVSRVFDHAPVNHNFVRACCICIYFILVDNTDLPCSAIGRSPFPQIKAKFARRWLKPLFDFSDSSFGVV